MSRALYRLLLALLAAVAWVGCAADGPTRADASSPPTPTPRAKTDWPIHTLELEKAWVLAPPDGERFDASGLLIMPNGEFWTVSDRANDLYSFRPADEPITLPLAKIVLPPNRNSLSALLAQKPSRMDGEGLAIDPQGRLYLCDEADRWVIRCDPKSGFAERITIDLPESVSRALSEDKNASYEGIAWGEGRLYLANERSPAMVLVLDPASGKLLATHNPKPKTSVFPNVLHYSDLAWHAGRLYVLARHQRVVLECAPENGQVLAEYSYAAVESNPVWRFNSQFPTGCMEGLAVTESHFYLLTDNNGESRAGIPGDSRPLLFRCPRPR